MAKSGEVSGFVFENEEQAKLAKKEVEGIQYIHDNMNMDNPQMVQEIYQRIMAQELFHTPIGYAYLKELQDYLKGLPGVDASEIPGIPVKDMGLDLDHVAGKEKSGEHQNENADKNSEEQQETKITEALPHLTFCEYCADYHCYCHVCHQPYQWQYHNLKL